MKKWYLIGVLTMISSSFLVVGLTAQSNSPYPFQSFRFRYLGPDGNRTIAVAGE
ncbi:MAG: hypothetical protein IM557_10945, partial [Chitinophagaceae bacterium]|nr:hypothetical protein [Chitinophagaceae bacterium]